MRDWRLGSGMLLLAAAWLGPWPAAAAHSFAAHMALHMLVVAVAAPLIAAATAGVRWDPVRRWPWLFAPLPASLLDLIVVWGWHAPALHASARVHTGVFALEQLSFLAAGWWLWAACLGGRPEDRPGRAAAGVAALVFTSIHMTLLGALFALAPRALYAHGGGTGMALALDDQHLGGALMILIGGASYLTGGLWLTHTLLRGGSGQPRVAGPDPEVRR